MFSDPHGRNLRIIRSGPNALSIFRNNETVCINIIDSCFFFIAYTDFQERTHIMIIVFHYYDLVNRIDNAVQFIRFIRNRHFNAVLCILFFCTGINQIAGIDSILIDRRDRRIPIRSIILVLIQIQFGTCEFFGRAH